MVNKPRRPTKRELAELLAYETKDIDWEATDTAEAREMLRSCRIDVKCAFVAVFDDYYPYCPSYKGKLMVVVWPHGYVFSNVYIWPKGKLCEAQVASV